MSFSIRSLLEYSRRDLEKRMSFVLIFSAIFLSRILFLSISPAFFDSLEYIRLFELSSLAEALRQAHLPVHPFWITTGWLFNKIPFSTALYKIEFLNGILGTFSCFLIYKIAREFTDKNKATLLTLICAFTPYFWLSQINVLYEPLLAVFLLGSFYYLLKKRLFLSAVFLFGGFLVSTTVLIYLIFFAGFWLDKKNLRKFWILGVGLIFGTLGYLGILKLREIPSWGIFSVLSAGNSVLEKLNLEGMIFFARGIRNSLVVYFNYLTVPVGLILGILGLLGFFEKKKERVIYLSWLISFFLLNSIWHAGMFGRLSLFLTLAPVFLLARSNGIILKIILLFMVVYSSFIVLPYRFKKIPYISEKEYLEGRAKDFLLIMSNYEEPYLKKAAYEYRVLNSPKTDLKEIGEWLENGLKNNKTVLVTSQAITAPYFQYDGMDYHILSKKRKYSQTPGQKLTEDFDYKLFWEEDKADLIYLLESKKVSP